MKKFLLIPCFFYLFIAPLYGDSMIKNPNVSGQFYPADPKELSGLIDSFVAKADDIAQDKKVAVLIVPHAGYIYSGWVAAYGYKAISKNRGRT